MIKTTPRKRPLREKVTRGSNNIFADIGLSNPEEALTKARLASVIGDLIRQLGGSQARAAGLLGIDQPKVSMLLRGQLQDFSVDRLLRFLVLLKQDVQIVISPHGKKSAAERIVHVN